MPEYTDANKTTLQIDDMLVLSTAHLPKHTDVAIVEEGLHDLRHHGAKGKEHPGMPATLLFPCGDGFYGYMLWADEGFKTMEASAAHPELAAVIEFALKRGCQWIRFDCDGPIVASLPTFPEEG